ncbi:MAG: hypothetical protein KBB52_04600 [Candidatus Omnitrophica bacterium]|nr:hypothetical protein [Candidatus Omnitrophota bacterium]
MREGLPILFSLVSKVLREVEDRPVVLLLDGDSCVGKTRFLNRRVANDRSGAIRLISRDDYILDSVSEGGVTSNVDWAALSAVAQAYMQQGGVRLIIIEGSELWRLHDLESDVRVWVTADDPTRRANMDRRIAKRGMLADGTLEPSEIRDEGMYHLILDNSLQYRADEKIMVDFFVESEDLGEDLIDIFEDSIQNANRDGSEAHPRPVLTTAEEAMPSGKTDVTGAGLGLQRETSPEFQGTDNARATNATDEGDIMDSDGWYREPDSDSIIDAVPAPQQDLDDSIISSAIKAGLSRLTEREELVLRALYGIFEDGFPPQYAERMKEELRTRISIPDDYLFSFEFVGHLLNVTRHRVRQIGEKALRKLRKHLLILMEKEDAPRVKIQRSRTMEEAERSAKDEEKIAELIKNGQTSIDSEDGEVIVAKLNRRFLKYSQAFIVSLHYESGVEIASVKVIDGKVPHDGLRGSDNTTIRTTLMGIAMRVARRDGYGIFYVLGVSSDALRALLTSLGFESALSPRGKAIYSFDILDKPLPLFSKAKSNAVASQSIVSSHTPVRLSINDEKILKAIKALKEEGVVDITQGIIARRAGISQSILYVRKKANPTIAEAVDAVAKSDSKILATIEALQKEGAPHITMKLIAERSGVSESVIMVRKRSNPFIKKAVNAVAKSDGRILAAIEALQEEGVRPIAPELIMERASVSRATLNNRKDQNPEVKEAIEAVVSSEGRADILDNKILEAIRELGQEGVEDINQGIIAARVGVSPATISRRKLGNPIIRQVVDEVASSDSKILNAIKMLQKDGVQRITISLIAERAGVTQETVFRRKRTNPVIREALDGLASSGSEVGLPQDGQLRLRRRTSRDGTESIVIDEAKPAEMRMHIKDDAGENTTAEWKTPLWDLETIKLIFLEKGEVRYRKTDINMWRLRASLKAFSKEEKDEFLAWVGKSFKDKFSMYAAELLVSESETMFYRPAMELWEALRARGHKRIFYSGLRHDFGDKQLWVKEHYDLWQTVLNVAEEHRLWAHGTLNDAHRTYEYEASPPGLTFGYKNPLQHDWNLLDIMIRGKIDNGDFGKLLSFDAVPSNYDPFNNAALFGPFYVILGDGNTDFKIFLVPDDEAARFIRDGIGEAVDLNMMTDVNANAVLAKVMTYEQFVRFGGDIPDIISGKKTPAGVISSHVLEEQTTGAGTYSPVRGFADYRTAAREQITDSEVGLPQPKNVALPIVAKWEDAVALARSAPKVKYIELFGYPDTDHQFRGVRDSGFKAAVRDGEIKARRDTEKAHWGDCVSAVGISNKLDKAMYPNGFEPGIVSILFELTAETARKYGIGPMGGGIYRAVSLKDVYRAWLVSIDTEEDYNNGTVHLVQVQLPGMEEDVDKKDDIRISTEIRGDGARIVLRDKLPPVAEIRRKLPDDEAVDKVSIREDKVIAYKDALGIERDDLIRAVRKHPSLARYNPYRLQRDFEEALGITREDLAAIIMIYPQVAGYNAYRVKKDYKRALGMRRTDIARAIKENPRLAGLNPYRLRENFKKAFGINRTKLVHAIMQYPALANLNPWNVQKKFEKALGMEKTDLAVAIIRHPPLAAYSPSRIRRVFKKAFGIDKDDLVRSIIKFPALSALDPARVQKDFEDALGITREDLAAAIIKFPQIASRNPYRVRKNFEEVLGVELEDLVRIIQKYPNIVSYSVTLNLKPKLDIIRDMGIAKERELDELAVLSRINLNIVECIINVARERSIPLDGTHDIEIISGMLNHRLSKEMGIYPVGLMHKDPGAFESIIRPLIIEMMTNRVKRDGSRKISRLLPAPVSGPIRSGYWFADPNFIPIDRFNYYRSIGLLLPADNKKERCMYIASGSDISTAFLVSGGARDMIFVDRVPFEGASRHLQSSLKVYKNHFLQQKRRSSFINYKEFNASVGMRQFILWELEAMGMDGDADTEFDTKLGAYRLTYKLRGDPENRSIIYYEVNDAKNDMAYPYGLLNDIRLHRLDSFIIKAPTDITVPTNIADIIVGSLDRHAMVFLDGIGRPFFRDGRLSLIDQDTPGYKVRLRDLREMEKNSGLTFGYNDVNVLTKIATDTDLPPGKVKDDGTGVGSQAADSKVRLPQGKGLRLRQRMSKDGAVSIVMDESKPPVAEMRRKVPAKKEEPASPLIVDRSSSILEKDGVTDTIKDGRLTTNEVRLTDKPVPADTQYAISDTRYENTSQPDTPDKVGNSEFARDSYIIPDTADWTTVFDDNSKPLTVEVGFGEGKYLLDMARNNPGINFIGIETNPNFVATLEDLIIRDGTIKNLRLVHSSDIYAARGQNPGICDEIYYVMVNPHDHSLAKEEPKKLVELLKPGGRIFISTDPLGEGLGEAFIREGLVEAVQKYLFPHASEGYGDLEGLRLIFEKPVQHSGKDAIMTPDAQYSIRNTQYEKEASTFVHGLKRRGYKVKEEAKKESDAIIVAVETNGYIPTEQRGMIQPLLRELTQERLGASFAKIGLGNVKFVQGKGEVLKTELFKVKAETGAKPKNVIVLGTKGTIESLSSEDELKGETEDDGAFFAEMDTTEISGFQYIRLLQMLNIALKAAYGERVNQSSYPMIEIKKITKRFIRLIPKAEKVNSNDLPDIYKKQAETLQAA